MRLTKEGLFQRNIYTARLQTVNMRCDLRHPFSGHIERFIRVAHSSQPGAADSFCAPTAGDAVLPLS